jgi:hypothetical protein
MELVKKNINICWAKLVEAPTYFSAKMTISLLFLELYQIYELLFIDLTMSNQMQKTGGDTRICFPKINKISINVSVKSNIKHAKKGYVVHHQIRKQIYLL